MDMDFNPPAPRPPSSRGPLLFGILLALAVMLGLMYLPKYMEQLEYSRTRGQVQAIDEALPDLKDKIGSLGKLFSLLAKKVGPSVVHIDTQQARRTHDIFGNLGMSETEGEASGVIVDPDGYIVTNNHVIDGADTINVSLSDGSAYTGSVIGADPGSDLAVVKISATNLIAAPWGDSDQLEVGEQVLAIGNPFGLDRSVTSGIISAKNRRGVGNSQAEFLQTDCAVNPGNSGGPLINLSGQIVGINTAIIGPSYQGISFALPSNAAKEVYQQLRAGQKVSRGYLGVGLASVPDALARRLGMKPGVGALVKSVAVGSPAEKAGIRGGDVIIQWNNQPIEDPNLLMLLVARTKTGSTVPATINRNGQETQLEVTVGQRPSREP